MPQLAIIAVGLLAWGRPEATFGLDSSESRSSFAPPFGAVRPALEGALHRAGIVSRSVRRHVMVYTDRACNGLAPRIGHAVSERAPLLAALVASLRDRAIDAMRVPKSAILEAADCCSTLSRSVPSASSQGPEGAQKAWAGFVAGSVCGITSVVFAGLCAWLACIELCAQVGKSCCSSLTEQLAGGARFGGAAARREPLC
jgi:hypothetical protein